MTHAEAIENFEILLDKAQAPYHSPKEKEFILYDALCEWLKLRYREFETGEKRREDINYKLVKIYDYTSTAKINLETLPNFFLIASVSGEWDFVCKGETTTRTLAIMPITHDALAINITDPFNVPSNAFPRYTQYNDVTPILEIHSDTPPTKGRITYIKTPERILTSTPTALCELPDIFMHEVLRHAVRVATGVVENFNKHQTTAQVEMQLEE